MKKPLSLNTQLLKLLSANKLLKQSLSQATLVNANGFNDYTYCEEIKQVIYSLRDIQYRLRGLNSYSAHRKAQTRKMSISDIRSSLKVIYENEDKGFGEEFRQNIFKIYTDLGSVEQYLQLHPNLDNTAKEHTDDELF